MLDVLCRSLRMLSWRTVTCVLCWEHDLKIGGESFSRSLRMVSGRMVMCVYRGQCDLGNRSLAVTSRLTHEVRTGVLYFLKSIEFSNAQIYLLIFFFFLVLLWEKKL